MSEFENPQRTDSRHRVTVDDIRELEGASTPHFAQQIKARIKRLIAKLPPADPARLEGESEIARLELLTLNGERRGPVQPSEHLMPSLGSGVADRRWRADRTSS